ncbi:MAG: polymer-forming cytoskeletal protein [Candidatus Zixiibacteriota bacterium]
MAENMNTVIGKDATITGTVEVTGAVRVDGCVKGKVISRETVVVGPTGNVEGDIVAKISVVAGQVMGNVTADEKVELQAKAVLSGDLKTKSLVIEQGAVFEGACRMKEGDVVHRTEPAKIKV